jgi:hypothetical protein
MNLNHYIETCHQAAQSWWHDPDGKPLKRNHGELLMLVVSELAEAMEGERKGLLDDKLTHRAMAEVEMADAFIRLCDFCGGTGAKLEKVFTPAFHKDFNRGEALLNIVRQVSMVASVHKHLQPTFLNGAVSQIIEYCRACGYDLEGAVNEKLEFNRTRIDHTHAHRMAEGGKKF